MDKTVVPLAVYQEGAVKYRVSWDSVRGMMLEKWTPTADGSGYDYVILRAFDKRD